MPAFHATMFLLTMMAYRLVIYIVLFVLLLLCYVIVHNSRQIKALCFRSNQYRVSFFKFIQKVFTSYMEDIIHASGFEGATFIFLIQHFLRHSVFAIAVILIPDLVSGPLLFSSCGYTAQEDKLNDLRGIKGQKWVSGLLWSENTKYSGKRVLAIAPGVVVLAMYGASSVYELLVRARSVRRIANVSDIVSHHTVMLTGLPCQTTRKEIILFLQQLNLERCVRYIGMYWDEPKVRAAVETRWNAVLDIERKAVMFAKQLNEAASTSQLPKKTTTTTSTTTTTTTTTATTSTSSAAGPTSVNLSPATGIAARSLGAGLPDSEPNTVVHILPTETHITHNFGGRNQEELRFTVNNPETNDEDDDDGGDESSKKENTEDGLKVYSEKLVATYRAHFEAMEKFMDAHKVVLARMQTARELESTKPGFSASIVFDKAATAMIAARLIRDSMVRQNSEYTQLVTSSRCSHSVGRKLWCLYPAPSPSDLDFLELTKAKCNCNCNNKETGSAPRRRTCAVIAQGFRVPWLGIRRTLGYMFLTLVAGVITFVSLLFDALAVQKNVEFSYASCAVFSLLAHISFHLGFHVLYPLITTTRWRHQIKKLNAETALQKKPSTKHRNQPAMRRTQPPPPPPPPLEASTPPSSNNESNNNNVSSNTVNEADIDAQNNANKKIRFLLNQTQAHTKSISRDVDEMFVPQEDEDIEVEASSKTFFLSRYIQRIVAWLIMPLQNIKDSTNGFDELARISRTNALLQAFRLAVVLAVITFYTFGTFFYATSLIDFVTNNITRKIASKGFGVTDSTDRASFSVFGLTFGPDGHLYSSSRHAMNVVYPAARVVTLETPGQEFLRNFKIATDSFRTSVHRIAWFIVLQALFQSFIVLPWTSLQFYAHRFFVFLRFRLGKIVGSNRSRRSQSNGAPVGLQALASTTITGTLLLSLFPAVPVVAVITSVIFWCSNLVWWRYRICYVSLWATHSRARVPVVLSIICFGLGGTLSMSTLAAVSLGSTHAVVSVFIAQAVLLFVLMVLVICVRTRLQTIAATYHCTEITRPSKPRPSSQANGASQRTLFRRALGSFLDLCFSDEARVKFKKTLGNGKIGVLGVAMRYLEEVVGVPERNAHAVYYATHFDIFDDEVMRGKSSVPRLHRSAQYQGISGIVASKGGAYSNILAHGKLPRAALPKILGSPSSSQNNNTRSAGADDDDNDPHDYLPHHHRMGNPAISSSSSNSSRSHRTQQHMRSRSADLHATRVVAILRDLEQRSNSANSRSIQSTRLPSPFSATLLRSEAQLVASSLTSPPPPPPLPPLPPPSPPLPQEQNRQEGSSASQMYTPNR